MRIALVHSFYASDSPSGENEVVLAQLGSLQRAGHETLLVSRSSDDIPAGARGKLSAAVRVATGLGGNPIPDLRRFAPDIVHIHNLFPNWGRTWVREWEGPIVVSLHNFRHSCAAGTFYRDGAPCTDCLRQTSVASLAHQCYRGSAAATLPLTISTAGGARHDAVLHRARSVVALSPRAAALHTEAGLEPGKITVIPKFVAPHALDGPRSDDWVYVGRLSAEKGIRELARAWPTTRTLDVYGAGPLERSIEDEKSPSVTLRGLVPPSQVQDIIARARGIVFPS